MGLFVTNKDSESLFCKPNGHHWPLYKECNGNALYNTKIYTTSGPNVYLFNITTVVRERRPRGRNDTILRWEAGGSW